MNNELILQTVIYSHWYEQMSPTLLFGPLQPPYTIYLFAAEFV